MADVKLHIYCWPGLTTCSVHWHRKRVALSSSDLHQMHVTWQLLPHDRERMPTHGHYFHQHCLWQSHWPRTTIRRIKISLWKKKYIVHPHSDDVCRSLSSELVQRLISTSVLDMIFGHLSKLIHTNWSYQPTAETLRFSLGVTHTHTQVKTQESHKSFVLLGGNSTDSLPTILRHGVFWTPI